MFIHIGNNIIVSDKKLVGIFNRDTLIRSPHNDWIISHIKNDDRTIAIDRKNSIIATNVSPFTIIKRTYLVEECAWRR